MSREKYEPHMGQDLDEQWCGVQAVHYRHRHIDDDKVRAKTGSLLDGIASIFRFSTNHKLGVCVEQGSHCLAYRRIVIHEQNLLSHSFTRREYSMRKNKSGLAKNACSIRRLPSGLSSRLAG